ncbi:hypothetical protein MVES1_001115 [Malassezia vespertilionis]|uniref:uncharacterized protein n=1 Tax=Malassezia vespertilionis TaxID=2020962 RepID=UPI0024B1BD34|nr:uncharacterized protein MVES1_001115 [Malassezia vespertilionis]WFD05781.1 hypothetical protein MVES1_001115 [Malassezia vespertilionis]
MTGSTDPQYSIYGYLPKVAPAIVMIVLFAISSIWQGLQLFYYKQWWLVIQPIGTLAEMVGYILFTLLKPILVMPVFVCIDVASLIVQAVGAAKAGTADSFDEDEIRSGSNIVLAGIAVQLFGYLLFNFIFLTFGYKLMKHGAHLLQNDTKAFMIAVFFSSLAIILRSIYRIIEMAFGWDGVINQTEWPLYAFDAAFVVIAVYFMNVWYPGKYLPNRFSWKYSPEKAGYTTGFEDPHIIGQIGPNRNKETDLEKKDDAEDYEMHPELAAPGLASESSAL